jgi:translation initiation factor IF-2
MAGNKKKADESRTPEKDESASAPVASSPPTDDADATPSSPEVLDLLDDSNQKKPRKKPAAAKKTSADKILPPISLLKDDDEIDPVEAAKAAAVGTRVSKTASAPDETDADGETDNEPLPENVIHLKPPIMIEALAEKMDLKAFRLIKDLMELGVFANVKGSVEPDIAVQVCEKHGFVFEREKRAKGAGVHKVEEVIEEPPPPEIDEKTAEQLPTRAPIITLMGHVDHGKTSLLDRIRASKVTSGEAGGITQHVAAYAIDRDGRSITFIDTPGHAAFARMRARGASVTDIVVLVVAADDGIMPQTEEAINHAREAGVTIVVALNKIDAKGADALRVKSQLQKHGLATTDLGGEIECVEVSALTGEGVDTLLDTLLLQAEMLELRADPKGPGRAAVIEASVHPGRGPSASAIVQSGTLHVGRPFICGPHAGKIKTLISDTGEQLQSAPPATPVEIIGFNDVPHVGDEVVEMKTDREARKLSEERQQERRKTKLERPKRATLDTIMGSIDDGVRKNLKIILKTDVQGTAEAIVNSLEEIESTKINLNIIHSGAGAINESDVLLASASEAVIIGFNTKLENKAVSIARREGVDIKLYSIIYELLDQVKEAMLGMLDIETREHVLGHAEVLQVFKLSKGRVGGSVVRDGKMLRSARARVIRGGQPVYDGAFDTLRRFQDDVKEVKNGLECGIKLGNYNDYKPGDIIECYELEALEARL